MHTQKVGGGRERICDSLQSTSLYLWQVQTNSARRLPGTGKAKDDSEDYLKQIARKTQAQTQIPVAERPLRKVKADQFCQDNFYVVTFGLTSGFIFVFVLKKTEHVTIHD